MFINYAANYEKSDDAFTSKWDISRPTSSNRINWALESLHSEVHEINWYDWTNVARDADGLLEGVIGSVDVVHSPVDSFHEGTEEYRKMWSVNYNCHCSKFTVIADFEGSQIIYCDEWGASGGAHDLSSFYEAELDYRLEIDDSYLLADRLYDGGHRLLTPFRGVARTQAQKDWNHTVSNRRILIENTFTRFKNLSILRRPFRGTIRHHRQWNFVLANFVNIDLRYRPLRRNN